MCEQCENRTTTSGYNMKLHSIYIDPTIEHKKIKHKYILEQLKKEAKKEFNETFPVLKGILEKQGSIGGIDIFVSFEQFINSKIDKAYLACKKEVIEEIKKWAEDNCWISGIQNPVEVITNEELINYLNQL